MKQFNKKAAALLALQCAPMVTASADTLDNVVAQAKTEGLNPVVHRNVVKVKSKAEADQKNAESDTMLRDTLTKWTSELNEYTKQKNEADAYNKTAKAEYDKQVADDAARTQTIRDANAKIQADNQATIKAYNEEVSAVRARNKVKEDTYNAAIKDWEASSGLGGEDSELARVRAANNKKLAEYQDALKRVRDQNNALLAQAGNGSGPRVTNQDEIDRITKENDDAQKAYLADKARVDGINKKRQQDYDAAVTAINAKNNNADAASRARMAKALADYRVAYQKWEADKKKIEDDNKQKTAEYDAAVRKATEDNLKIDEDNRKAREQYNKDLDRVTQANQKIDADNRQKQEDYDRMVALVGNGGNGKKVVSNDEYIQHRSRWQRQLYEYTEKLKRFNDLNKRTVFLPFTHDLDTNANAHEDYTNKNNMNMTLQGGAKFIPNVTGDNTHRFDPSLPEYSQTSDTPIKIDSDNGAEAYAVLLPQGGSVTVEYTLKSGENYMNANDFKQTRLVTEADLATKQTFDLNDSAFKGVKKIRYTIRNDKSSSAGGKTVVMLRNTMYHNIRTGLAHVVNRDEPLPEDGFLNGFTVTREVLDENNNSLVALAPQFDVNAPAMKDPLSDMKTPDFTKFVAPNRDASAFYEDEVIGMPGGELKSASDVADKPSDWKTQYEWMTFKDQYVDGKMTTVSKYYSAQIKNKQLQGIIWSTNNPSQTLDKPERPVLEYTTTPVKPTLEEHQPVPKEPVDKPHVATPEKPVLNTNIPEKPEEPKPSAGSPLEALPPAPQLEPVPTAPVPRPVPAPKLANDVPNVTLIPEPKPPVLDPLPTGSTTNKPRPEEPVYEEIPKAPVLKQKHVITPKTITKLMLKPEPKAPNFEYAHTTYVYEHRTIFETVTGDILKPWSDGEIEKMDLHGYEFVKTLADENGDTHHIYKPVVSDHTLTIWETTSGRALRSWEQGRKDRDVFEGYQYVKTTIDEKGFVHHVYAPIDALTVNTPEPSNPVEPAKPTETTEPVETPKPIEPSKPAEPDKPTKPMETPKPVEPNKPTNPVETPRLEEPIEPDKPSETPVDTPRLEEPTKPVETPTEPDKPSETPVDTPTEPTKPVDPVTPTDRDKPVEIPTKPTDRDKPAEIPTESNTPTAISTRPVVPRDSKSTTQAPTPKQLPKQLPQTGDTSFALLGTLSTGLGALSIRKRKKR